MATNNSWTNLNNDGRRLERIIKLCETNISKAMGDNPDQTDHDLVLAYIDRLVKATTQKSHVVDFVGEEEAFHIGLIIDYRINLML